RELYQTIGHFLCAHFSLFDENRKTLFIEGIREGVSKKKTVSENFLQNHNIKSTHKDKTATHIVKDQLTYKILRKGHGKKLTKNTSKALFSLRYSYPNKRAISCDCRHVELLLPQT